jgi:hypothetical protein
MPSSTPAASASVTEYSISCAGRAPSVPAREFGQVDEPARQEPRDAGQDRGERQCGDRVERMLGQPQARSRLPVAGRGCLATHEDARDHAREPHRDPIGRQPEVAVGELVDQRGAEEREQAERDPPDAQDGRRGAGARPPLAVEVGGEAADRADEQDLAGRDGRQERRGRDHEVSLEAQLEGAAMGERRHDPADEQAGHETDQRARDDDGGAVQRLHQQRAAVREAEIGVRQHVEQPQHDGRLRGRIDGHERQVLVDCADDEVPQRVRIGIRQPVGRCRKEQGAHAQDLLHVPVDARAGADRRGLDRRGARPCRDAGIGGRDAADRAAQREDGGEDGHEADAAADDGGQPQPIRIGDGHADPVDRACREQRREQDE